MGKLQNSCPTPTKVRWNIEHRYSRNDCFFNFLRFYSWSFIERCFIKNWYEFQINIGVTSFLLVFQDLWDRTKRHNLSASFWPPEWGGSLPKPHPNFLAKFFRHITLFLGNTLLNIFLRQLIATLMRLLCQKYGKKSAELGKLTEILEIVDNSMQ